MTKPDYLTDDEWRRARRIIELLAERDRIIYGDRQAVVDEWIPVDEFVVPITTVGALKP